LTQDWQAVATAIADRLDERGMTMTELAAQSGVSLTTVRELVHALNTRRRQPRTLTALSVALGWPSEHLGQVLRGQSSATETAGDTNPLGAIRAELRDLQVRVSALEAERGEARR
jgi:lambda repressor-like predicted transcriptional regulator